MYGVGLVNLRGEKKVVLLRNILEKTTFFQARALRIASSQPYRIPLAPYRFSKFLIPVQPVHSSIY